ncbi:carbamoyltransferase N-terminal domain-containing protein, partial [Candidatus Entotheonella palauensis]
MIILGINAYHGDAAAVLIRDGTLVAAVEEERLRRIKHWAGMPQLAIETCLRMANATADEIDIFAIPRQPRAHWWRKAGFVLRHRPRLSFLRQRQRHHRGHDHLAATLADALGTTCQSIEQRLFRVEHHQAHLDSAFYAAPFDQAAVCAIDGFGDFVSTSTGLGRGTTCKLLRRVYFPHSLGLLYLAITQYLGFTDYGDEYKVMGLAAHGTPDFDTSMQQLVSLQPGGRFSLDLSFFCHWSSGDHMTWENG